MIDHESVSRHFAEGTIKVNPMSIEMLIEILKRAETKMEEIKFEEKVIAKIVELANGYPHWVHLLGKLSCIDVVENDGKTVRMENFQSALIKVAEREIIHEDTYMKAISGSKDKERMLRILASDDEDRLDPEEKYKVAEGYGISYADWHYYIQDLMRLGILQEIQYHFTNFRDIRFKVYCRIRRPSYAETESLVANWMFDTGRGDFINFNVENFKLDDAIVTYLNANSTDFIYDKASKFVPITSYASYGSGITARPEPKTILYDSKGNPIKKAKS
jgi:hypothetical protein